MLILSCNFCVVYVVRGHCDNDNDDYDDYVYACTGGDDFDSSDGGGLDYCCCCYNDYDGGDYDDDGCC